MPVSVVSRGRGRGLAAPLRALVRAALASESCRPAEVAVVLAGDPALRALNRRWRRLDRATDVLSFGYDEAGGTAVSGDIVVSMDRVAGQARRFRVSRGRELARLVVHGALHLAGLDHRRPAERRAMRAREERVLGRARHAIAALDRALAGTPGRVSPAGRRAGGRSPSRRPASARRASGR